MEKHKESIGENRQNAIPNAKTSGSRTPNVPALRFPEFTGEWRFVHLEEVAEFQKQRIFTALLNNGNYISTENILQNFEGIQYSSSIPANTNVIEYQKGDILLSNIRPYLKKVWFADRKGGCSADVFVLRGDKCDQHFLYYVIASNRFINYVMSGAKGVKMPRGDKSQMEKYAFSIPTNTEQRKIAKFLSMLDERIRLQNKIIEDLKKLKSALYQEMFGSLVAPTSKLGQVAEIVKGKQVNGTELLEQGDYYVMNGGTLPSGWLNKFNTEANTISISEGGNSCGYVQYNTSRYWSGGHCYSLKILHPQEVSDLYLYHFLKWQEGNIMALRIGSGLPNIQKKDLRHFPIILPTITKQKSIISVLTAIDAKIACEVSLTEYYTMQKDFLLRDLFI